MTLEAKDSLRTSYDCNVILKTQRMSLTSYSERITTSSEDITSNIHYVELPFFAPGGGSYMKLNPTFAFSSPSKALRK